jgi:uncharacterized repeat protein (TIGR03803 family)
MMSHTMSRGRIVVIAMLAITMVPLFVGTAAEASSISQHERSRHSAPIHSNAQMTYLYVFAGPPDGGHSDATVAFDAHGSLFGVTTWGGPAGIGTVYRLTPSGSGYTESVLHSFSGRNDGSWPYYGLIAKGERLFGTTSQGGAACSCGVVLEMRKHPLAPLGYEEHVLYRFRGQSDGRTPSSQLVYDDRGNLYGTTQAGGSTACSGGCGTIFELTPTRPGYKETVLYRFQGNAQGDGQDPIAGLVSDGHGDFYGTTLVGGGGTGCTSGCGTVFKLTPSGSGYAESVLYRFRGGAQDGAYLFSGVILDHRGHLFGTTSWGGFGYSSLCDFNGTYTGCGIVFELSPSGSTYKPTILHEFTDDTNDGAGAWGGVTFGEAGTLYGTTLFGGNCGITYFGCGTVYSLTPEHGGYTFSMLYSFPGFSAAFPYAPLAYHHGALYGTTAQGGVGSCDPTAFDCGTVFRFTP